MNYYSREPLREEARITPSSVILLVIFVSAVLFIAYAGLTRPWASDDTPAQPALEQTADGTDQGAVSTDGGAEAPGGDTIALEPSQ